jgi:hypothetical protein
MSEFKSRIININKPFQLLGVPSELRSFVTKDKETIDIILQIWVMLTIIYYKHDYSEKGIFITFNFR